MQQLLSVLIQIINKFKMRNNISCLPLGLALHLPLHSCLPLHLALRLPSHLQKKSGTNGLPYPATKFLRSTHGFYAEACFNKDPAAFKVI
jgi:hypothetical protein